MSKLPPPSSADTPRAARPLVRPFLGVLLLAGATLAIGCSRDKPPPRTGPRANLALVRIDDESDPLGTERPAPLAGMSIDLVREQHSSRARSRRPTTFAQIAIPKGPSQKEATERAAAWLATIDKPAGTRFALGERLQDEDGDGPAPKLLLRSYLLTGEPAVTTVDVVDARVERQSDTNRPVVLVKLSPSGAKRFGDVTREWQGQRLAIVLDDLVMSAPLIMSAIEGGQVSITLGNDATAEEEAKKLANALRP